MKNKPQYIIVAGVNGAGKSTLFDSDEEKSLFLDTKRINADEILQKNRGDWRKDRDNFGAMREVVKQMNLAINTRQSFHQETTLAGNGQKKWIDKAKKQGFEITLLYVGLASPELAIERVKKRVEKGGHGVPEKRIRERYKQSLKHLKELMPYCDNILIFDNTDTLKLYFKKRNQTISFDKLNKLPWWKNGDDDSTMEKQDIQTLLSEKDTSKLAIFLKEQINDYKQTDLFKNYLDFIAKCPRYSSRNIQFLQKQKPNIGRVATFTKWKEQGFHIKKGSKGYKIFMPIIGLKYKNGEPVLDEKGNKIKEIKGFKLGTVFEDKQLVEYENLPKPVEYLNQNPNNTKDLFMALSEVSPVKIGLKPLEVDGFYSSKNKQIFINANLHGADLIHTLIHEITHSSLHDDSTAIFGDKQYTLQELEAESTAYIVANNYDIDTSKYTMGYLNSWGLEKISSEDLQNVMENIQKTAKELIEKIDVELDKRKNIEPKKTLLQTEIEKAKNTQKSLSKKTNNTEKNPPSLKEKMAEFDSKKQERGV